jgi:hypothetical protein
MRSRSELHCFWLSLIQQTKQVVPASLSLEPEPHASGGDDIGGGGNGGDGGGDASSSADESKYTTTKTYKADEARVLMFDESAFITTKGTTILMIEITMRSHHDDYLRLSCRRDVCAIYHLSIFSCDDAWSTRSHRRPLVFPAASAHTGIVVVVVFQPLLALNSVILLRQTA